MKILFFVLFLVLNLNAKNADEFFTMAENYEKSGDYKNAAKYYKAAALAVLGKDKTQKESAKTSENFNLATKENSFKQIDQNSEIPEISTSQNSEKEPFLGLKYYEPNYFLFSHDFSEKKGRKANEARLSFSFERPLSYDLLGFGEKISFAYTQNSWWQITDDSAPFRETNYRPEIFVSFTPNFADELKIGLLHESNGKDGQDSRSWNKIYAATTFSFGNFSLTPRVWYGFAYDDTNSDIDDYMGYGDIRASYDFGRQKVFALWRNNLKFDGDNRGALELNYAFPIFNTGIYGYLQYFTGYGESLADYRKSVDKIGLGIAFIE